MKIISFYNRNRKDMLSFDIDQVFGIIRKGIKYQATMKLGDLEYFLFNTDTRTITRALRSGDYTDITFNCGHYLIKEGDRWNKYYLSDEVSPPELSFERLKWCLPASVFTVSKYKDKPDPTMWKTPSKLEDIERLSGYASIDIDDLNPAEISSDKDFLFSLPYVVAAFLSPSGSGIKLVVKYTSTFHVPELMEDMYTLKDIHRYMVMKILKDIMENTCIAGDDNAIDINRLCYLPYDPEILVKDESDVIPFEFDSYDLNGRHYTIHNYKEYVDLIPTVSSPTYSDVSVELEELESFLVWLTATKVEPFGGKTGNYESKFRPFLFGLVDLAKTNNIPKDTIYSIFYRIVKCDKYYGHEHGGDSFIRDQFENKWNTYNPQLKSRTTYKSAKYLINSIRSKITPN